jgi:hypothetical protein
LICAIIFKIVVGATPLERGNHLRPTNEGGVIAKLDGNNARLPLAQEIICPIVL